MVQLAKRSRGENEMHYTFEKDGIRTVVPCTKATMSRAYRAYRDHEWVDYDPSVLGITLAGNRRQIRPRALIAAPEEHEDHNTAPAILVVVLILVLMGIAGGIENGLIF
jgi:hypothetical protein